MKKLVLYIFVFVLFAAVVQAACSEFLDAGDTPGTFGYVSVDGVFKADTCSSSTKLTEYSCNGNTYASTSYTCLSCSEGVCYTSSCSQANQCNPVLQKWCDAGAKTWSSSSYCTDSVLGCYLKDASCTASTCTEGSCDYKSHTYCSGNTWVSEGYCDVSHCAGDAASKGYCFCADTKATSETDCSDNKDNDCDGKVDCNDSECSGKKGCECTSGSSQQCGSDVGACSLGTQTCVSGSWGACSGVEPSAEKCDGKDDDCNGVIDNDCICVQGDTRDCGANIGICKAGIQICQNDGSWSLCYGASYAASKIESCNGLDDNCNGQVDEGCGCVAGSTQICGSTVGVCKQGMQNCVNGTWDECLGGVQAFPEICGDSVDNDCDGLVDSQDDTCASQAINLSAALVSSGTKEETKVGECSSDSDCSSDSICRRNMCVSSVATSVSSGTSGSASSSGSSSSSSTTEKKSTGVNWLLFAIPLFLLLFALVYFVFKQKNKSFLKKSEKGTQKVVSPQVFQSMSHGSSVKKKNYLDETLEQSFKESSQLFKK
ncbi:hypothetical protein HZA98_00955 [Candidatus Woesearchaeota archaeon]|nr:hypothetical protein [Candidatus Woesearchaeota archaeon]